MVSSSHKFPEPAPYPDTTLPSKKGIYINLGVAMECFSQDCRCVIIGTARMEKAQIEGL